MASLVGYLQRMTSLEIVATQTIKSSQTDFIQAEEALLECEENISNMTVPPSQTCVVQSVGKQLWKISTSGRVVLESVVHLDDASGNLNRLSWRQVFKER